MSFSDDSYMELRSVKIKPIFHIACALAIILTATVTTLFWDQLEVPIAIWPTFGITLALFFVFHHKILPSVYLGHFIFTLFYFLKYKGDIESWKAVVGSALITIGTTGGLYLFYLLISRFFTIKSIFVNARSTMALYLTLAFAPVAPVLGIIAYYYLANIEMENQGVLINLVKFFSTASLGTLLFFGPSLALIKGAHEALNRHAKEICLITALVLFTLVQLVYFRESVPNQKYRTRLEKISDHMESLIKDRIYQSNSILNVTKSFLQNKEYKLNEIKTFVKIFGNTSPDIYGIYFKTKNSELKFSRVFETGIYETILEHQKSLSISGQASIVNSILSSDTSYLVQSLPVSIGSEGVLHVVYKILDKDFFQKIIDLNGSYLETNIYVEKLNAEINIRLAHYKKNEIIRSVTYIEESSTFLAQGLKFKFVFKADAFAPLLAESSKYWTNIVFMTLFALVSCCAIILFAIRSFSISRLLRKLEKEVYRRERTENELYKLNLNLETEIIDRSRQLKESNDELKSLLTSFPDPLFIIDSKGEILDSYVPKGALDHLIDEKHPEEKKLSLLISNDVFQEQFYPLIRNLNESRNTGHIHFNHSYNNHSYVVDVRIIKYASESFLVIFQDLTYFSDRETKVLHQNQVAIESSRLLCIAELSTSMSHEINNPLSIVSGYIEKHRRLTQKNKFDKDMFLEDSDRALRSVKEVAKIINDIREFSKTREDEEKVDTPVSEIIEKVLEFNRKRMASYGIDLRLINISSDHSIFCQPNRLSQAILNLINNSIYAVKNTKDSWIEIQYQEGEIEDTFLITDSGQGIDLKIAEQVMNPFFSTKPSMEGTGVGLSVAEQIVKDHHGELKLVTSSKNTRFAITLSKRRKTNLLAS